MTTLKIRKFLFWFLLIGGFTALGSVMLRPPPFYGSFDRNAPNISAPDALIRSHSLSKLPPDLLRIRLANDVLTEDFVAYYEQNENRMALSGTLRRIAYEHKLDFPERVLESVFDANAEVALWRDDAGRLKDFLIVLSRNQLARAIQTLLPAVVKATDMQLSSAGKLDGTDVEILVLKYGIGHHLALLSKGDRIVALSNPGMLLSDKKKQETDTNWPQSEKAVEIIRELLEGKKLISPFAQHFLLKESLAEKEHELTFGARSFAFNYEAFVPGLAAVHLTFNDRGEWQSAVLLDGAAWRDDGNMNLWAALPHGPGFCAALPVDWTQIASVLKKFDDDDPQQQMDPKDFTANFSGPAAVCWYKDSRLYTPLFAARLNADANEAQIQEFFNLAAQATRVKEGETSMNANSALWQGEIASRFGSSNSGGERSLKPALAIRQNIVFFSPDATLVDNALAVSAKRYPALADSFHANENAPLVFADPNAMASLLKKEIFTALPRDEEALFRNAAEVYLVPRLEALASFPTQHIGVSKIARGGYAWYPLKWSTTR